MKVDRRSCFVHSLRRGADDFEGTGRMLWNWTIPRLQNLLGRSSMPVCLRASGFLRGFGDAWAKDQVDKLTPSQIREWSLASRRELLLRLQCEKLVCYYMRHFGLRVVEWVSGFEATMMT